MILISLGLQRRHRMISNNILILDTETTGLKSDDEIISIGIINHLGEEVFNRRFKPITKRVPDDAIKIHGITNEDLAECDTYADHHDELMNLLYDKDVWCYNSKFDSRLLTQTVYHHDLNIPYSIKWSCAMEYFTNRYNPLAKWTKLSDACKYFNINVSDLKAHDAVNDCVMAHRLMERMGI